MLVLMCVAVMLNCLQLHMYKPALCHGCVIFVCTELFFCANGAAALHCFCFVFALLVCLQLLTCRLIQEEIELLISLYGPG